MLKARLRPISLSESYPTGLGLATVYGTVKQNTGFVNVCSEPGKGTAFRIYLPRDTSVNNDAEEADTKTASLDGNKTILLVEDETAIRTIMRLVLEKLGYIVIPAESPPMVWRNLLVGICFLAASAAGGGGSRERGRMKGELRRLKGEMGRDRTGSPGVFDTPDGPPTVREFSTKGKKLPDLCAQLLQDSHLIGPGRVRSPPLR